MTVSILKVDAIVDQDGAALETLNYQMVIDGDKEWTYAFLLSGESSSSIVWTPVSVLTALDNQVNIISTEEDF